MQDIKTSIPDDRLLNNFNSPKYGENFFNPLQKKSYCRQCNNFVSFLNLHIKVLRLELIQPEHVDLFVTYLSSKKLAHTTIR